MRNRKYEHGNSRSPLHLLLHKIPRCTTDHPRSYVLVSKHTKSEEQRKKGSHIHPLSISTSDTHQLTPTTSSLSHPSSIRVKG
ncbi:hypothetical protein KP509_15G069100 [Ceratopteris richardii]|uniref:Uncharacterized protein n=1 Tax=Ceratopteris richardii TaxID=49495 RepID=A0A8T2T5U9_CERRI|nr:hypothetical protein KP509_15G069100 [Ceratopteris richardii]